MLSEMSVLVQAASSMIAAGASVGMLLVMLNQRPSQPPAPPAEMKGARPQ